MIVDRKTFIAIMVHEGGIDEDLVFMPELDRVLNPNNLPPAQWFLHCPIVKLLYRDWWQNSRQTVGGQKAEFWNWCEEHLTGALYCYYEDESHQWWGFENKGDIFLWSLKWL